MIATPATRKAAFGNQGASQVAEPPPIVVTMSGMPEIGCPPDRPRARPRAMLSVASVTMKGCGSLPYT
jgi:hypothetical protein